MTEITPKLVKELLEESNERTGNYEICGIEREIAREYVRVCKLLDDLNGNMDSMQELNETLLKRLATAEGDYEKLLVACPKGTTVRAGKTYADFQYELCQKQSEIDRLRWALAFYVGYGNDGGNIAREALME